MTNLVKGFESPPKEAYPYLSTVLSHLTKNPDEGQEGSPHQGNLLERIQ